MNKVIDSNGWLAYSTVDKSTVIVDSVTNLLTNGPPVSRLNNRPVDRLADELIG